MLTRDGLHSLATEPAGELIVSVFARTDPRDPSNTTTTPGWQIALRDGLSALTERLEASGERTDRLAFRPLRERIEKELLELDGAERARSVALFVDIGGDRFELFSLQLPVRRDLVIADSRPFVSPLVDIADRGCADRGHPRQRRRRQARADRAVGGQRAGALDLRANARRLAVLRRVRRRRPHPRAGRSPRTRSSTRRAWTRSATTSSRPP